MQLMWLETLKKLPRTPAVIERYFVAKARNECQKENPESESPESTLWVDISVISRHDAGSGIQRVVRALLSELQGLQLAGWRVQPVAATPRQAYRAVPWDTPTVDAEKYPKIEPLPGDIFLGLDLSAHIVPSHHQQLVAWKARGLKFAFVIYDLLPLHCHQWFSAKLVRAFRRWIKSVAILADKVFCISQPVREDFENLMWDRYGMKPGTIQAHVFPMGGDIKASRPSNGVTEGFFAALKSIGQGTSALMVGTLEPRKGHAQVLDAFEQLWTQGKTHKLIIVGKPGWMTKRLQHRIRSSAHLDDKLFWFDNASDEALEMLYQSCSGVIVASFAEGYGLPLLEAIEHGKPVLARDLVVFRQFESPLVSHFPEAGKFDCMGDVIDRWLSTSGRTAKPNPIMHARVELPTWRSSLNVLLGQLLPPEKTLDAPCRGWVA